MSVTAGYLGVEYEPQQMAWRVRLGGSGLDSFDDSFADEESAVLVRELVILVRGLEVVRNFPELDQAALCARLRALLEERDLLDLPDSLAWLERVPMTVETFEEHSSRDDRTRAQD